MADERPTSRADHAADIIGRRRSAQPEPARRVPLSEASVQDHADSIARRHALPTLELIDDRGEPA